MDRYLQYYRNILCWADVFNLWKKALNKMEILSQSPLIHTNEIELYSW